MLEITRMELRTVRDRNGRIDTLEANIREGDNVKASGRLWRAAGERKWQMIRIDARGVTAAPNYEPTGSFPTAIGRMVLQLTDEKTPEKSG